MKQLAGFVVGALVLTAGCAAPKAASVQRSASPSGSASASQSAVQAITTADAAVAAVTRENPTVLKRFSRQPGKVVCPQNIGGPAPGVVLDMTCEMKVVQKGSAWVITLIQDYNFNGPHEFTMTYEVSAAGLVSQPTLSGDPVPNIP